MLAGPIGHGLKHTQSRRQDLLRTWEDQSQEIQGGRPGGGGHGRYILSPVCQGVALGVARLITVSRAFKIVKCSLQIQNG